jgi:outer membrane protein assembly factor BamB
MGPNSLLTFCILLLPGSLVRAGDWPQWRGPGRDARAPGDARVSLAGAAKPLWRIDVGAGMASPVVVGNRVYHVDLQSDKETVHSLDAQTGKELWAAAIDDPFRDGSGTGARTTPLVDGKLLFVQSCKGELRCLKADDGAVVWRTNFVNDFGAPLPAEKGAAIGAARHGNTASPLVDGENLIACVGSPKDASVVCFKKATGQVVWKCGSDMAGYAAPVLADIAGSRQLVIFTAESVLGIEPAHGKLLWRVPLKTGYGRHVATPVVADDHVLVGSYTLGLVGLRISRDGEGFSAQQAWAKKELGPNVSSPILVGGRAIVHGAGPSLAAVDPRTGTTAWTQGDLVTAPRERAHAAFITIDSRILLLSGGGELCVLEIGPDGCRVLERAKVCGPTWCSPAYADGKLYLRDAKQLMCLNVSP